MKRDTFRLPTVVTFISFLLIALSMVRTYGRQSATLRALDTKETIPYFIAEGTAQTGYRSSDRELAQWALAAWQRSAGKDLRFEAANESTALVRVYWAGPEDGQFGETRPLTIGKRRGAAVFIRPDVDSLGEDLAQRAKADTLLRDSIVYLTCLHELGHALGLEHTRDFRDIMYFFGYGGDITEYFGRYRAQLGSRSDISMVSGLSDADVSHIRALYDQ